MNAKVAAACAVALVGMGAAVFGLVRAGIIAGPEARDAASYAKVPRADAGERDASWLPADAEYLPTEADAMPEALQAFRARVREKVDTSGELGLSVAERDGLEDHVVEWAHFLLSGSHDVQSDKAVWFEQLGFSPSYVDGLRERAASRPPLYGIQQWAPIAPDLVSVHLVAEGGQLNRGYQEPAEQGLSRATASVLPEVTPLGNDPIRDGATVVEVRMPMRLKSVEDLDASIASEVGLQLAFDKRSQMWIPYRTVVYTDHDVFTGQITF